jgi:hypothetical protein
MTRLAVLIANHNTADFLAVSLPALDRLTRSPFAVYVNDDGSSAGDVAALERLVARHPRARLFHHAAAAGGSHAHGAALDFLFAQVDAPYTAVLDADCTPLLAGWDEHLIGLLDERTKVAGSTLGEGWAGNKPVDFPLPFLALFETAPFRELGISARPGDIAAGQDTCWEWREKLTAAGYAGRVVRSVNTRLTPVAPFEQVSCAVYYTDDGRLLGSHFGRGANPAAKRPRERGRLATAALRLRGRRGRVREWRRERDEWSDVCRSVIDAQGARA